MGTENTTLSEVATQSLIITAVITFSQISGLLARFLFKLVLPPEQYGLFAFFINMTLFAVGLNGLSLHIPLIATISKDTEDRQNHVTIMAQILAGSFILGTAIGLGFFIWTAIATSNGFLSFFYAIMVIITSTGQIAHCYPRGLDEIRPAVGAYFIIGLSRILLLITILFTPLISIISLELAAVIYTFPSIGWWLSYFYTKGFPKLKWPDLRFVTDIYIDAGAAYLFPFAFQLPQVIGIGLLSILNDYSAIGDFDIALIPYSFLSMGLTGLSFIVLNKARKMGSVRGVIRKLLILLFIPSLLLSLGLFVLAFLFEGFFLGILIAIGLPASVYWPAVVITTLGFPPRILLVTLASYFQGNGIIKPIGLIAIASTIGLIPIEIFLVFSFSVMGLAVVVVLESMIIALSFVVYGLRMKS